MLEQGLLGRLAKGLVRAIVSGGKAWNQGCL